MRSAIVPGLVSASFNPAIDPRLFPFQHFRGEFGLLYDATENIQRLLALPRAAQAYERDARPILVEMRAELSANVSQDFGNLVFGQTACAQIEQMQGQCRPAGFFAAYQCCCPR